MEKWRHWKLHQDQVKMFPFLTTDEFLEYVQMGHRLRGENLVNIVKLLLRPEHGELRDTFFEQFRALNGGFDPVFYVKYLEQTGGLPIGTYYKEIDPILSEVDRLKVQLKEQELEANGIPLTYTYEYLYPEIKQGSIHAFKEMTCHLQAGRKYANLNGLKKESNHAYIHRLWRDLESGLLLVCVVPRL